MNVFVKNREIYFQSAPGSGTGNRTRFTVFGIECMAGNHVFDDFPERFGITELEGKNIRAYIQTKGDRANDADYFTGAHEKMINDFYRTFPNVFEGESKGYIDNPKKLRKGIPLFDD